MRRHPEDNLEFWFFAVLLAIFVTAGILGTQTKLATTQPTDPTVDRVRWEHSVDARLRKLEAK